MDEEPLAPNGSPTNAEKPFLSATPTPANFINEGVFGFSFDRVWNVGVQFAQTARQANSYRVSNQLAFAFMWLGLPFLLFTYKSVVLSGLLVATMPLFLLTLYLNANGRHLLARIWLVCTALGVLIPLLAIADPSPAPEYRIASQVILLALVAVPLVLFDLEEREPLWTLTGAVVTAYFSFHWLDGKLNLGPGLPEAIYFSYPVYWLLSGEAFLLLILSFGYFKRANERNSRVFDGLHERLEAREKRLHQLEEALLLQTGTLTEVREDLARAKSELIVERNQLVQQQQRLRGVEESLSAREAELRAQRNEEQLLQRYDSLVRGMLAEPVPHVLTSYLQALVADFPFWQGVAWVHTHEPNRLVAKAGFGVSDNHLHELNSQPVPELLLNQVRKRTLLYTEAIPEGELVLRHGVLRLQAKALLLVPLMSADQLVGMLELVSAEPLTQEQLATLQKLAATLAVLLQGILTRQQDPQPTADFALSIHPN